MTDLALSDRLIIYAMTQGLILIITVGVYFAMRNRSPLGRMKLRQRFIMINVFMVFVLLVLFDSLGLFNQKPLQWLIGGVAEAILIVIGRPQ